MFWNFDNEREERVHITHGHSGLYAKRVVMNGKQSYLRGFQIVRRQTPYDKVSRVLRGQSAKPRRCTTFVALDWKHI